MAPQASNQLTGRNKQHPWVNKRAGALLGVQDPASSAPPPHARKTVLPRPAPTQA